MLEADFAPAFGRDVKRCRKKHRDMDAYDEAMQAVLASDEVPIPPQYNDHALTGNWQGFRELHIGGRKSDWLLIYRVAEGVAMFVRNGSHDELY